MRELLAKLKAADLALRQHQSIVMRVGIQTPGPSGLTIEELREMQAIICSLASAAQAECNRISEEIAILEPPE